MNDQDALADQFRRGIAQPFTGAFVGSLYDPRRIEDKDHLVDGIEEGSQIGLAAAPVGYVMAPDQETPLAGNIDKSSGKEHLPNVSILDAKAHGQVVHHPPIGQ
ncbi:MAG: hypothetical protein BWY50_02075 [Spirochaetes bacterium ADurb.Bin315]|nr:MAG: hypothetical protein BWY50_02075 [Spirochaetes bacterium ADurb.Bin315]